MKFFSGCQLNVCIHSHSAFVTPLSYYPRMGIVIVIGDCCPFGSNYRVFRCLAPLVLFVQGIRFTAYIMIYIAQAKVYYDSN